MAVINIRPYESNLRGSSNTSSSFGSAPASNQNSASIIRNPAKIAIAKPVDSAASTTSNDLATQTDRQRVESKTSNQLFSSASTLTVRSSLNENLSNGVIKLKSLAEDINNEVDPTKKDALIEDANSLLSSLQTEYNDAVADDPNLAKNVNISSLVKPGADPSDGSKFKDVQISAVLSPNASGLSSVDFSNYDDTIDKLDTSIANYSIKQSSYDATASQIAGATSKALNELESKGIAQDISKKEEEVKKLADQITTSKENLLEQNKVENKKVEELIDNAVETKSSESSKDSSKQDTPNKVEKAVAQSLESYAKSSPTPKQDSATLDIAA